MVLDVCVESWWWLGVFGDYEFGDDDDGAAWAKNASARLLPCFGFESAIPLEFVEWVWECVPRVWCVVFFAGVSVALVMVLRIFAEWCFGRMSCTAGEGLVYCSSGVNTILGPRSVWAAVCAQDRRVAGELVDAMSVHGGRLAALLRESVVELREVYRIGFVVASLETQLERGGTVGFLEYRTHGGGYCGFSGFLQGAAGVYDRQHVRMSDVEFLLMLFERFVATFEGEGVDYVDTYHAAVAADKACGYYDKSRAWWATSGTLDVLARMFEVSVAVWVVASCWGGSDKHRKRGRDEGVDGVCGAGEVLDSDLLVLQHLCLGGKSVAACKTRALVHLRYDPGMQHYTVLRPCFENGRVQDDVVIIPDYSGRFGEILHAVESFA